MEMAKSMRKILNWKLSPRKNVYSRARLSGMIITTNCTRTNPETPPATAANTANMNEACLEKEIVDAQYFAVKSTLTF